MWAHLTYFYAGGPDLSAAWGFIGAAQPLAQVKAQAWCNKTALLFLTLLHGPVCLHQTRALTFAALQVFGAPVAYVLLQTDGFLGLRGWQWLFIMVKTSPEVMTSFDYMTQIHEAFFCPVNLHQSQMP